MAVQQLVPCSSRGSCSVIVACLGCPLPLLVPTAIVAFLALAFVGACLELTGQQERGRTAAA